MPGKHKNRNIRVVDGSGRFLYRINRALAYSLIEKKAATWVQDEFLRSVRLNQDETCNGSESAVEATALWKAGVETFSLEPNCTKRGLVQYCRQKNAYRRGSR